MDAIITAGGTPRPDEPLYTYTKGGCKALLDIAGKPMIQWVLDAFSLSQRIERVVVVGLPAQADLKCSKPVMMVEDQGGMIENIQAGVKKLKGDSPQMEAIILSASDIPAITSEMIDWLSQIVERSDCNVYYTVISRRVMESRYPGSRRTYVHLKDVEVCGGDLHAIRADVFSTENPRWKRLVDARKNPLKQASILGFDTLLGILFRRFPLNRAVAMVGQRIDIRGEAVVCPYAEVGMDVDKPHQLEQLCADLAQENL